MVELYMASDSLWNWFGRQIGHVKKAVTADVTKPALPKKPAEQAPPPPPEAPNVIYRDEKTEEVDMPDRPGVKLRRTVIDEVIVDEKKKGESSQ
jgi:hypothetical protein